MENSMEMSRPGRCSGLFGAHIQVTSQENFIHALYTRVDEATAWELGRLRCEEGIVVTCHGGCCHCCRYHILVSLIEIHTLAQYVRRTLSQDAVDALRQRMEKWHAWDASRPGRYPLSVGDEWAEFSDYDHCCPLLVDGLCSIYPVRPMVCRTHFVSSHPLYCCAAQSSDFKEDAPVYLPTVVMASHQFSMAIRGHIETQGLDFSKEVMLLPHGLALEMGWIFR